MSNVLMVPARNEGRRPLRVVETALQAEKVDAAYVVDGWSTDDTVEILQKELPALSEKYGKPARLMRSDLRNTGKGGAMVTGIRGALAEGHRTVSFLDADITSLTSRWCDLLIGGIDRYDAAMTRGYFDRSPFDAQITRHVTRPLINLYFPEGRPVNQPLGGELCFTAELARYLLDPGIAPPHTWGIDTFFVINALMGGYSVVEIYLTQKTHNKKSMDELRAMFLECFDEGVKQVAFHERHQGVPAKPEPLVRVLPRSASDVERVGEDVRTMVYVDVDEQIASFEDFVAGLQGATEQMEALGLSKEIRGLFLQLFDAEADFREESEALDARTWVRTLDQLVQGYIVNRYDQRYHDLLFAIWKARALSFSLHEARTFEAAEEATERQAWCAYELGQERYA